ncbi:MAG: hypothetical protein OER90_02450 [Gemmatimonadota bacterium]|nr:hypothetical protein [Gemmatimonadota bacterium]
MFRLSKWYLDCVTDAGDAAVLYWASLKWGIARLRYGAALVRAKDGERTERYTLRPGPEPTEDDGGGVQWTSRRLQASGSWKRSTRGMERTLLDTPDGSVHWRCVSPSSVATVVMDGRSIRGSGYVEHLTMTVKPWRLPFNELTWGRFHSSDDALVWIKWGGGLSRTWAFLNGVEWQGAEITPHHVALSHANAELNIEGGCELRSGRLANTALRSLWVAAASIPRWRKAHESKWLARGTLVRPSGISTGWALHEAVEW